MTQTGNLGWLVWKRRGSFEDLTELSGGSSQVGHYASYATIIRSAHPHHTHTHIPPFIQLPLIPHFLPAVQSLFLPQRCDTPLFLSSSFLPLTAAHTCTCASTRASLGLRPARHKWCVLPLLVSATYPFISQWSGREL